MDGLVGAVEEERALGTVVAMDHAQRFTRIQRGRVGGEVLQDAGVVAKVQAFRNAPPAPARVGDVVLIGIVVTEPGVDCVRNAIASCAQQQQQQEQVRGLDRHSHPRSVGVCSQVWYPQSHFPNA
eukprot:COSAG01_NODE_5890_length_3967_cov_83.799121_4_plen_125_part_00